MTARPFVLARHEDPSGISGVGIVAEGVAWTGGTADLHWLTDWETFVHWPGGVEAILAVHGHQGATVVRFLDEPDPRANRQQVRARRTPRPQGLTMKPSELLRKGAEEIGRRGWTQDWFGSDLNHPGTCQVCAIGGLRAALTGDPFKVPPKGSVFDTARAYLAEAADGSVVIWNDEPGRDVAEVLALFERAAANAEAKGV